MEKLASIRVMIVDDHRVVRSGLAAFLASFDDMELIGEAASGRDALHMCAQLHPDVVLMDLMMPDMNGAHATRLIRQEFPHVQVIALTSFWEKDFVQEALQSGAISYLIKNVSTDELGAAIRAAHHGRATLAPEATEALIRLATQPLQPLAPGQDLTARERAVLGLMVKGMSNPNIAAQLSVSNSTVKFYVSNILSKLRVASRVEAVALALEHRLIAH